MPSEKINMNLQQKLSLRAGRYVCHMIETGRYNVKSL